MLSSKGVGVLATIPVLCPQLAQPRLSPLRGGGLRDQTAQDELAGRIEPMRRERIDDVPPDLLFEGIQVGRRFRAALPRHDGHYRKRGCGLAAAGHGTRLRCSPKRLAQIGTTIIKLMGLGYERLRHTYAHHAVTGSAGSLQAATACGP